METPTISRPHMALRQTTHQEQADEDARFWRDQPVASKMRAIAEMAEWYARMHGIDLDAQGPKRTARVVQRPQG